MSRRWLQLSCVAIVGCASAERPATPRADALQQAIDRGQCGGDLDRVDYSDTVPDSDDMLSVVCAPQDRGPPNVALRIYGHVDPRGCDDCTLRTGGWLDATVWIAVRRAVDVTRLWSACTREQPALYRFSEWRDNRVASATCADDPPSVEWARAISAMHLARQKVTACSQFNPVCFDDPATDDPPWVSSH